MCYNCGYTPCRCYTSTGTDFNCNPCNNKGDCPITLDFTCILYHKNNSSLSELTGLNLTNGVNLEVVIEAIDIKIRQISNLSDWDLEFLRASNIINTIEQFATATDSTLSDITDEITTINETLTASGYLGEVASDPVSIENGQYWFRIDLPVTDGLRIKLNGSIRTIPTI